MFSLPLVSLFEVVDVNPSSSKIPTLSLDVVESSLPRLRWFYHSNGVSQSLCF